jgi:hypothetical protein
MQAMLLSDLDASAIIYGFRPRTEKENVQEYRNEFAVALRRGGHGESAFCVYTSLRRDDFSGQNPFDVLKIFDKVKALEDDPKYLHVEALPRYKASS